MPLILVYITTPDKSTARRISQHLLKKRLAACCVIFPVESHYWWKKRIEHAKEFVLIAKAPAKNFSKIKIEAARLHPYDIPCIVKLSATSNAEYFKWIRQETKSR